MTQDEANLPDATIQPVPRASIPSRPTAEAKGRVRDLFDSGKEHVIDWKDGLADGIRERPLQSVLIAAAVGAVLGALIGRRTR